MAINVRKFRKDKGMSQQQLAVLSGYSQGYISQLENGVEDNPTFECLGRLAEALGTSVANLLENEEAALDGQEIGGSNAPVGEQATRND